MRLPNCIKGSYVPGTEWATLLSRPRRNGANVCGLSIALRHALATAAERAPARGANGRILSCSARPPFDRTIGCNNSRAAGRAARQLESGTASSRAGGPLLSAWSTQKTWIHWGALPHAWGTVMRALPREGPKGCKLLLVGTHRPPQGNRSTHGPGMVRHAARQAERVSAERGMHGWLQRLNEQENQNKNHREGHTAPSALLSVALEQGTRTEPANVGRAPRGGDPAPQGSRARGTGITAIGCCPPLTSHPAPSARAQEQTIRTLPRLPPHVPEGRGSGPCPQPPTSSYGQAPAEGGAAATASQPSPERPLQGGRGSTEGWLRKEREGCKGTSANPRHTAAPWPRASDRCRRGHQGSPPQPSTRGDGDCRG